jgi:hypothetical protein
MTTPAVLAAALFAAAAHAAPTQIEAEYSISNNGIVIGRVVESYVRNGDRYRIESVTRSEGPLKLFLDDRVTLSSEGSVGPGGLVPRTFEQRRARDGRRDIRATFHWDRAELQSEFRGEEHTEPLPTGTQDRLSVMYQFMNFAPRGNEVRVHMSNGRKVELYAYRKVDEPLVKTPAGDFDTLHYERITANDKESRAQLWLAKDRFHLPVRVVFDDPKGLRLDQTLVSLTLH